MRFFCLGSVLFSSIFFNGPRPPEPKEVIQLREAPRKPYNKENSLVERGPSVCGARDANPLTEAKPSSDVPSRREAKVGPHLKGKRVPLPSQHLPRSEQRNRSSRVINY